MHTKFTSLLGRALCALGDQLRRARRGNVAMIFALVAVPIIIAGGAGIDLARALAVRGKLYTAVDAAALAVASKTGITQTEANTLGQQYFNANYKLNNTFGTPAGVNVVLANQSVTVTVQSDMPTTLMNVAGFQKVNLTASSNVVWGQNKIWVGIALDNTGSMCQSDTNTSTGGPCPTPGANTKIYALKTATKALLTMFQNTAATAGDVQASIIPFARDVKVDTTAYAGSTWIDWSGWDESHGSCSITSKTSKSTCEAASTGYCTVSGSVNSNFTTQSACNVAGSCTISGYYSQTSCQNATQGTCTINGNVNGSYTSQNSCQNAYVNTCTVNGVYNASYTSKTSCEAAYVNSCSRAGYSTQSTCVAAQYCSNPAKTTSSSCTGQKACDNGSYTTKSTCQGANFTWANGTWITPTWDKIYGVWGKTYGIWTTTNGVWTSTPGTWTTVPGVWTIDHSGWTGCIGDRGDASAPSNPAYDTVNTSPGTPAASKFPAVDTSGCPSATLMGLGYNWTSLNSKVDDMIASGNTNQTIGLAWAWHSISQGAPLTPPSLPTNTARHIIILSDGENTQNRWSNDGPTIDGRMNTLCTNAKNDGITVWTVFVNIAGTAGNADSMKNCATGGATGGKYIEVTSAGGIGNAFNVIGQQITNLRVAH